MVEFGRKEKKLFEAIVDFQPRLIRLRDAPDYLGMDKNRFNAEVRPYLVEIPIGEQGIAFDRLDLDVWVDDYKTMHGRPAKGKEEKGPWRKARVAEASKCAGVSGISTSASEAEEYAKARERAISRKPKKS